MAGRETEEGKRERAREERRSDRFSLRLSFLLRLVVPALQRLGALVLMGYVPRDNATRAGGTMMRRRVFFLIFSLAPSFFFSTCSSTGIVDETGGKTGRQWTKLDDTA